MNRPRALRAVAPLAALAAAAAFAQAPSPEAPLTLTDTLELALRNNEAPGIARARLEQARARSREAWAGVLPEAVLQASYTRQPETLREVGGAPVVIRPSATLDGSATLGVSLVDAPAIPRIVEARWLGEAQRFEGQLLVQELLYDTAEAFYGVLSAEELRAAAERRVQVATEALEVARRRLAAGVTGRQEATRSELELSQARLALQDARLIVQTRRLVLGELAGTRSDVPLLAPDDAAPPPPIPEGLSPPDVLALRAAVRAAETARAAPWLELLPSLGAQASYQIASEPSFTGEREYWSVLATATWVVYDGGVRYAQMRARNAEADELRLTLAAAERAAARAQQEARLRIEVAGAAVEEATLATRIAGENAEEVGRLFDAGLATALERADATAAAYEAEAALAQQKFALRVARLTERRTVGLWPAEGLPLPEVAR